MRWLPLAVLASLLIGCGTAPVAPPSQAVSPLEATARTGTLELSQPAFRRYNQELDRTICDLSKGTILAGGMLSGLGIERPQLRELLNRRYYAALFQDEALLQKSQQVVSEWANVPSAYQAPLRSAWERIATGLPPRDTREQDFAAIYRGRKARWQRLCDRADMPLPSSFRLYRGVKGDFMAETVFKAWKDETSKTFRIPHYTLSSWSLSEQTAYEFRGAWGMPDPWIVFEATVPFEKTLLDKWVDGSTFVDGFPGQHEVVVATREENELVIPDTQATVWFGERRYAHQDRAAFIKAWESRAVAAR